jgi:hypothetical protein
MLLYTRRTYRYVSLQAFGTKKLLDKNLLEASEKTRKTAFNVECREVLKKASWVYRLRGHFLWRNCQQCWCLRDPTAAVH